MAVPVCCGAANQEIRGKVMAGSAPDSQAQGRECLNFKQNLLRVRQIFVQHHEADRDEACAIKIGHFTVEQDRANAFILKLGFGQPGFKTVPETGELNQHHSTFVGQMRLDPDRKAVDALCPPLEDFHPFNRVLLGMIFGECRAFLLQ